MATQSTVTERLAAAERIGLGTRLAQMARALAVPLGSVLFAFLIGGVVVAVTGGDPVLAYSDLLCGGIGVACNGNINPAYQISETLVFTTPLILTGLAVAVAFRAGLFNIGAEGQLIAGVIAATVIGIKFATWPGWLLLPLVLIAGALAGALWGGIAGVLKATTGAHEVVTTIMLNYVALWLTRFLIVGGPLQAPRGQSATSPIGAGAQLPTFIAKTSEFGGLPGGA